MWARGLACLTRKTLQSNRGYRSDVPTELTIIIIRPNRSDSSSINRKLVNVFLKSAV
jgi:hypothetical protein